MNHSPYPHIVRFSELDATSNSLRLQLLRPAAAGREVCLSYGPLTNGELLLFYGFTVNNNPAEKFTVQLAGVGSSEVGGGSKQEQQREQKLRERRAAALERLGLKGEAVLRPAWRARQLERLLPAARVLTATEERLQRLAGGRSGPSQNGGGKAASSGGSSAGADAAWPFQPAGGGSEAAAVELIEAAVARARAPYSAALGRVRAAMQQPEEQFHEAEGGFSEGDCKAFLRHLETLLLGVTELLAPAPV